MSRKRHFLRLLTLAGVLGAIAWGCSTDSPTAPQQTPAPPSDGPPRVYRVTVQPQAPGGIVIDDLANSGDENLSIKIRAVNLATGNPVPDGTLLNVTTSLGSFDPAATLREVGVGVANGEAFVTLFADGPPSQLGVATIAATLQASRGTAEVPIQILVADFFTNNPENNLSVRFTDNSRGNPRSFFWEFGDGATSTQQNPLREFVDPGTYTVRFTCYKTVAGVRLSSTTIQNITVAEEEEPPMGEL